MSTAQARSEHMSAQELEDWRVVEAVLARASHQLRAAIINKAIERDVAAGERALRSAEPDSMRRQHLLRALGETANARQWLALQLVTLDGLVTGRLGR
jgi:DNA-binding phage protein